MTTVTSGDSPPSIEERLMQIIHNEIETAVPVYSAVRQLRVAL